MAEPVTGGAAVVDALAAHGARHVFGIPGTHNLEIYRYLPDSPIRHVVTRHEQGAGYAADGYARVTGRPGVLVTTSGPGITNAITALATAYADSVPLLAVSPGPPRGQERADVGWLHEVKDQQAALDAVTARSIRVESADEVPETVAEIFEGFASGRPRSVHLEVPVDVLEGEWIRRAVPAAGRPEQTAAPHPEAKHVAELLTAAARPLLVAGGGARGATDEIHALAERGIAVLTTVNGKGVLDETHPSALGASVRLGSAHRAMNDADLLLVVGSELGDSDLWGGTVQPGTPGGRTVVRVDIDPAQLNKNVSADVEVLGDAALFLGAVLDAMPAERSPAHTVDPAIGKAIDDEAAVDGGPWAAVQAVLRDSLPADTVVAGDSSQVTYLGTVHHWPFTPRNRLLYPTGYATLGYGLPAAIGAKVADPSRPVIALVGDGAVMFSIQELATAAEQRLSIPVIVVDNGGYAEIREQMKDRDIEPQAVDLPRVDLPAVARAMGGSGVRAESVDDLGRLAAAALAADGPTLIHHIVDAG